MIRGIAYSRSRAVASGIAVAAMVAVLALRIGTARTLRGERASGVAVDRDLASRIDALSPYDDRHLALLREKVSRFRVRLGQFGSWDRIVARMGERWSMEPGEAADRGDYSVQSGTFRMKSAFAADWPEILDVVGFVEDLPGAGIGELEIRSAEQGPKGALGVVRIVVILHSAKAARRLAFQ
jgi:hypothetical protein